MTDESSRDTSAGAALDHARQTRPGLDAASLRANLPYRNEDNLTRFIAELEAAGLE